MAMKLSFATLGCPGWSLEQIASNAARMGYDGVELRGVAGEHIGPDESAAERARIRKLFESSDVAIAAIMGYSKFTADDPDQRQDNIRLAVRFLETARDIGCPVLRVFGGQLSETLYPGGNVERVAEALRQVAEHAERTGVTVALETHDAWTRGADVRAVLDAVGSARVCACWDVANSFFAETPETTCSAIGDRLAHVHFKDAKAAGDVHKSCLPGRGEVDLEKCLSLIAETGYDGYLSFEWEKKWEADLAEPEVAFPHFASFVRDLISRVA